MNECRNLESVGQVEELLLMTEQMQDELDQKDQTILELNRQLSESLTLNEKLNSENRAENIEALRTRLRQTEQQLTSEIAEDVIQRLTCAESLHYEHCGIDIRHFPLPLSFP